MLTLGILLSNLFPFKIHLVHSIYYAIRAVFYTEPQFTDTFDGESWSHKSPWYVHFTTAIVSMCLSAPNPFCADFVFIPYVVCSFMGYPMPVWHTIGHGALFTLYLINRPTAFLVPAAAILDRMSYNHTKKGLALASACHLILSLFEEGEWSIQTLWRVTIVIYCAEMKLRMKWNYEWVPPVEPLGIIAIPAYVGNLFIYGWTHTWKYTDKVLKSPDIMFCLSNVLFATIYKTYFEGVSTGGRV